MNTSAPSCLLLVESDNQIAQRITTLAETLCTVVRRTNAADLAPWLHSHPSVNLVITDPDSAQPVTTLIRQDQSLHNIPVLVAYPTLSTEAINPAPSAYTTDLLDLTEESNELQAKINYYLDLDSSLLSAGNAVKTATYYIFRLPWWKRLLDVAVSLSALLILSPLLIVVAILIKLDSKGPILYKSARAGTNFRVFSMYKFRTMKAMADHLINDLKGHNIYARNADQTENSMDGQDTRCDECRLLNSACRYPLFDQSSSICEKKFLTDTEGAAKFMKFRNDPRITRFGTFLRNSSIDELPQLLNILLGDMSLVGNRPLPLYEAEKLTTNQSAQRFAGPAGLTGLWQVKKRAKGEGPVTDSERIALDIEYASTFSFKTDMYIIWQTIFSVWQKENV